MAIRNRDTLKKSFSEGQRPTEDDFRNLIDSTVNILDDGFSKNAQTGIRLAPLSEEEGTMLTFLQNFADETSRWEVSVVNFHDLKISKVTGKDRQQLLVMKDNGDIELGCEGKQVSIIGTLDVTQRKGNFVEASIPADGKWHDVTEDLEGICALEIVSVYGKKNTGKHGVLIAQATHCFGSRARIRRVRSHYGSFGNRIKIRWVRSKNNLGCRLQLRTRFFLGDDIFIRSNISRLWDDPMMEKKYH